MNSIVPTDMDKIMTSEQFTQVVDAILAGKYSWACVLILRFAGYNPLHYIPYRTYNRLTKENSNSTKYAVNSNNNPSLTKRYINPSVPASHATSIRDLNYLEPVNQSTCEVRGGFHYNWLSNLDLN